MARPRRNTGEKSAYERIRDAYWKLLSEMPYSRITIEALSREAGVNHNSIYYHFDNIEDMAVRLFEENLEGDVAKTLITAFLNESASLPAIASDKDLLARIQRTRLYMKSENPLLSRLVKKRLKREWFDSIGISEECLSWENRADIEFIFSGIIDVVGSDLFEADPVSVMTMNQRTLGKGAISALKELSRDVSSCVSCPQVASPDRSKVFF
jgi:AcrR family transcriptional regulator